MKLAEFLQQDASLRERIEQRNLRGAVSLATAVEVAVELAAEHDIHLTPAELEETIAVLQAADLVGGWGEPALRQSTARVR
jgi:hypothetical protein